MKEKVQEGTLSDFRKSTTRDLISRQAYQAGLSQLPKTCRHLTPGPQGSLWLVEPPCTMK